MPGLIYNCVGVYGVHVGTCMSVCVYMFPHVAEVCTAIIYSLYFGEGCLIVCFCGRLATVQGKKSSIF